MSYRSNVNAPLERGSKTDLSSVETPPRLDSQQPDC
ncbi:hypothetical protein ACVI9W_002412 [Pseudomonas sp. 210_17 TE3656]